jgi:hypothetical protein
MTKKDEERIDAVDPATLEEIVNVYGDTCYIPKDRKPGRFLL